MNLENRFLDLVSNAYAAYKDSLVFARDGDKEEAEAMLDICNVYRAQASLILDNCPRIMAIMAARTHTLQNPQEIPNG